MKTLDGLLQVEEWLEDVELRKRRKPRVIDILTREMWLLQIKSRETQEKKILKLL